MIYIFTAMYCEAEPLIKAYSLRLKRTLRHIQIFETEESDIVLTITGTGRIHAAAATAAVLSMYDAKKSDFLINIGSSAAISENMAGIYICNKITDAGENRTYYPDMLYNYGLKEAGIITGDSIYHADNENKNANYNNENENINTNTLYDMEASAVYQAGSLYFGPDRIVFIKAVSDYGMHENEKINTSEDTKVSTSLKNMSDKISRLISDNIACIQNCIEIILNIQSNENISMQPDAAFLEQLSNDMCCSAVMKASLIQHIRYCHLAGIDYKLPLQRMYEEEKLPCNSKREGKERLEELKRQLL